MDIVTAEVRVSLEREETLPNGAAMAAFLAAGIGASAMGIFVILNEAGAFAAPTLYGPTGGLSGRSTLAVVAWAAAWSVLHSRWRTRQLSPRPIVTATLLLIALGVFLTFPPVWSLVS
jgi:hypothetical protein